ncbi:deoxyribodipyrimidine photolyase [Pseudooceanicola batsensis HTCC2597]|uniref:Deoxyribodipyrimidine photolyase n=1 Tax=Pseudooceanicola batsensis (strain ATCC BAA-863 / DSM 15984 / KCTC 12145 / HTCC2597) TaxID=252305 RepID=A3U2K7_PSEBH|nr:deoxyribodipyrimidine photo-lyase [Pseudooceanicola batsensis]EAQ01581.1 deoxyribodipyrimidine photolyase [Pseudooceanicola batsensis HTCC2597]
MPRETFPTLLWFRRDLRLSDHPALTQAAARGPVIPVFIHDDSVAGLGAAPKWRLGEGLAVFRDALAERGARLILRRGPAREVLERLIDETGATAVYWTRAYDPDAIERDSRVKAALADRGTEACSFPGHLIFEPWEVETQQGKMYQVYSPYWRAVKDREVDRPLRAPDLSAPSKWPDSEALEDWHLGAGMNRGAAIVARHCTPGEGAAQSRLGAFSAQRLEDYKERRDMPAEDATSDMSQYLTLGEISPRQLWHAALRGEAEGKSGAEHFRKEVVWREFAYHLMYHTPRLLDENWREGWEAFCWSEEDSEAVRRWKQGRTGVRFVDAAMREMYVTGRMHNRSRMVVASYLTKHMLVHWRIGQKWFQDCLIDWDPASNSMGWQWVAGCGPDASPYFRVFNPDTQLEKFDRDGRYVARWLAECSRSPSDTALSYFDAIPESWGLSPEDDYPEPVVDLKEGRRRALAAYEDIKGD